MRMLKLATTMIMSSIVLVGCSSSGSSSVATEGTDNNSVTAGDDANAGGEDITGDVGSSPPTNTGSGNATQWGFVEVEDSTSGSEVGLSANFIEISTPLAISAVVDAYSPDLDTCEVSNFSPTTGGDDFELPDIDGIDSTFTTISAGQSLVFTSNTGTYAELQESTILGFTFYEPTVESILGPLPEILTLDIPGAEFPSYSNVSIPTLGTVESISPSGLGAAITPTTQFTWAAATIENAYMELDVSSINLSDASTISVSCIVVDDGEFSFPAETQSAMGESFNSLFGFSLQRKLNIILESGNSLLIVESSSSY